MPSSLLSRTLSHISTGSRRPSERTGSKLPSEQLDIWEHAALLYHSYEWHDAVEAFQYLARFITAAEGRTLCALNAGMIQARLGDYMDAAQTFEEAARDDRSFMLTPYLLGVMQWELGNLIKAEACLEVCLQALRGGDVIYNAHGLDFVLQAEAVRGQLRLLKNIIRFSSGQRATPVVIAIISAECIFEAPPRSPTTSATKRGKQRNTTTQSVPFNQQIFAGLGKSSQSSSSTNKSPREAGPLSALRSPTRSTLNGSSSPASDAPLRSPEPLPYSTYYTSWRRRPSTPYIARDAKGEYTSVRELTRFIQQYQHQPTPLSPRNARVEPASTRELARFIKYSGREPSGTLLPDHVRGEPVLRASTFPESHAGRTEGIRRNSLDGSTKPTVVSGAERKVLLRRYSGPSSAHPVLHMPGDGASSIYSCEPYTPLTSRGFSSPATVDDDGALSDELLELLMPKVYDPNPEQPEVAPPSKTSLVVLDYEEERTWNPLGNLHTAASSTSDLFRDSMMTVDRADLARMEALRVLEGRQRPGNAVLRRADTTVHKRKPLPPTPNVNRFESVVGDSSEGNVRVASSKIFDFMSRR